MRVVGGRVGMIVMAVVASIAVHRVLDMLALFPARLAVKGQEDEAPRIEAGEEGDENADPESDNPAAAARERRLEDAVLRIEAGKARDARDADAGDRQRAEHHRPIGDRDLFPQIAVIAHRSEEHTSELQSLMRISYAVFCLKKKKKRH